VVSAISRCGCCLSPGARDERRGSAGWVDRAGPESGGEETFWGSIEAGGSPSRQETLSGELKKEAGRVKLRMPEYRQRRGFADATAGECARKPRITARGGIHRARAGSGVIRRRGRLGSRLMGLRLAVTAAARLAATSLGAFAMVRSVVDASRRGDHRGGGLLGRDQRADEHGRHEQPASLADLSGTTCGSHAGRPSRISGNKVKQRHVNESLCMARDRVSRCAYFSDCYPSSQHRASQGKGSRREGRCAAPSHRRVRGRP
jgi:hypothetical protein